MENRIYFSNLQREYREDYAYSGELYQNAAEKPDNIRTVRLINGKESFSPISKTGIILKYLMHGERMLMFFLVFQAFFPGYGAAIGHLRKKFDYSGRTNSFGTPIAQGLVLGGGAPWGAPWSWRYRQPEAVESVQITIKAERVFLGKA